MTITTSPTPDNSGNYTRMGIFSLVTIGLIILVAIFAGQELMVGVWKLTLVVSGPFIGYWADRHAFPYARPHLAGADSTSTGFIPNLDPVVEGWQLPNSPENDPYQIAFGMRMSGQAVVFAACMIRRAIIMGSVTLGMALAL